MNIEKIKEIRENIALLLDIKHSTKSSAIDKILEEHVKILSEETIGKTKKEVKSFVVNNPDVFAKEKSSKKVKTVKLAQRAPKHAKK